MYSSRQPNVDSTEVARLREACGAWLRKLREKAGLSQREMAEKLGIEYYSFISQIETGKGRVPTNQIESWANLLRVSAREMALTLMRFYDPINYRLLFGDEQAVPVSEALPETPEVSPVKAERGNVIGLNERIALLEQKALEERVKRLEALLLQTQS